MKQYRGLTRRDANIGTAILGIVFIVTSTITFLVCVLPTLQ
jgi:hypothetical protein